MGVRRQPHAPAASTPGKDPLPIVQEAGWTPGPSGRVENLVPTGIRSRTDQPAVSRFTDWTTRHTCFIYSLSYLIHSVKIDNYVAYLFDNELYCSPEMIISVVMGLLIGRYGVRYLVVTRYFSHIPIICSGSEAYWTSYWMGFGGYFLRGKLACSWPVISIHCRG